MPNLFLNFNLLRTEPHGQIKGWSNRPEFPLFSKWRKKKSLTPPPSPKPTSTATSAPVHVATTSISTTMRGERTRQPSASQSHVQKISTGSTKWQGSRKNSLFIHPICRCCTDVVNSITGPYKRRTSSSKGPPNSNPAVGSGATKQTWDGLPSTQYLRLSPEPDHAKLRDAKFRSHLNGFVYHSSPSEEKKPKKKKPKNRSWKFWPSIV